jgi:O-antigen/teichoic acid export membrane protein
VSDSGAGALGQSVRKGIRWLAVAQVLAQFVWLLVNPLLARLLSPADYGLYNTTTVALGFLSTIAGLGLSAAVIQRKELSDEEALTAFWASVCVGLLISVLAGFLSPLLALVYREPQLTSLGMVHALTFAAGGVMAVPMSLFSRQMRFDRQVYVSLATTAGNALVSIGLARAGFGPFSLALGVALGQLPAAALALRLSSLRVRWHFRWDELKRLRRFSLYNAASQAAGYLLNNLDYLLVGYVLGKQAHGLYTQAFLVTHFAYTQIMPSISRVVFSAFSRQQDDDEALARGYLRATRTIAAVTFPVLAFLGVFADVVIDIYFGERWHGAIPYVRILAVVGALKCVVTCVGLLINAKGRADLSFRWSMFILAIMAAALGYGVRFGVEGVCWAWVAVFVPQSVAIKIITHRLVGLSARRYVSSLGPAVGLSLLLLALLLGLRGGLSAWLGEESLSWGALLALALVLPVYGFGVRRLCPWVFWGGERRP